MDLLKPFRKRKTRKAGGRRGKASATQKKKRARKSGSGQALVWTLGVAAVVVILGVGLLNWTRTRQGQATLLSLGSEKMYGEVQTAVDGALFRTLPDFPRGAAAAPADHDWPAPDFGPGAMIRCRSIAVPAGESWWEIQARIADAVHAVGARVLWGGRLLPARVPQDQSKPSESRDLLRLDLGVPGKPTHTLVLHRVDVKPRLQWGAGPGLSRWAEFASLEAPVVALVIDDWGHSKVGASRTILDLPGALTMAVLPHLSYSRYYSLQRTDLVLPPGHAAAGTEAGQAAGPVLGQGRAERLAAGCIVEVSTGRKLSAWPEKRREVMLHLPMQPQNYPDANPGPRALLVGMDRQQIRKRLDEALQSLTNVTGVNNHMGSAATSDEGTMRDFMVVLREKDLFFVDSLTSARSVAYAEAIRAGIPAARNRIFLDYDNENETTIAANLDRLVQSARSAGFAVGIGHPHRATAAVLARKMPEYMARGVRFVTISELMALQEFRAALAEES